MAANSDDDSADFLPSTRRRLPVGDTDTHPLLVPLADAADAMARLEASVAAASAAVAEGLRARVAYREAAGWLAHAHTWIHPRDLALIGIGGHLTAPPLPHHRAYGSRTTAVRPD